MLLVHYGSWKFDLKKFKKIANTTWCKPEGGLWTSPLNTKYDWKEFCISENFSRKTLYSRMVLKLCSRKILKIDSLKEYNEKLNSSEKILKISTIMFIIGALLQFISLILKHI